VKRYKNLISVDQIRSFAGALLINGMTRGMFVTTSSFQSGAERTSALAGMRGIAVELVDAQRFYDALGIAQRNAYETLADRSAPYADVDEVFLSSYTSRNSIS
jgi:restriction endonuclease Mrr